MQTQNDKNNDNHLGIDQNFS